jgi:signal transduction histidine kinase
MQSLRWRVATWYAALLLVVIVLASLFLGTQLHGIVLDQARARVDRVGSDIARFASRSEALVPIGEASPADQELAQPSNMEHWASPTTFIQLDNIQGYPIAKSANMGGATFTVDGPLKKSVPAYSTQQTPVGEILVRAERLEYADGTKVIVLVGEQLDLFRSTLNRIWEAMGLALGLAMLAIVAGSFIIASRAIAPINALTKAVGSIGLDELNRRVGWSGRNDEVGKLADSFDEMLGRLEQGYARERQFISDASHELKTPLTIINANAQMLERWADRDPDVRAESLAAIKNESGALARMVSGMLVLAKAEAGDAIQRESVNLESVIAEAVAAASHRASEKNLALDFTPQPGRYLVFGNADLLRQLFGNLVENALKFTETGGVRVTLAAAGGSAVAEVLDSGVGIEEAELERIFDRFYRTDKSRDRAVPGTGLGLAIVRSIARVHDGSVTARARPEGGTAFVVTIPLAADS